MDKNILKITTVLCGLTIISSMAIADSNSIPLEKGDTKNYENGDSNTGGYINVYETSNGSGAVSNSSGSSATKNVEKYSDSTVEAYNAATGTTSYATKDSSSGDIEASNSRGGSAKVDTIKGGGANVTVNTANGETKSFTSESYDSSTKARRPKPVKSSARYKNQN